MDVWKPEIAVRDRRFLWKSYPSVFLAHEAITSINLSGLSPTREDVVSKIEEWRQRGLVLCTDLVSGFADGSKYYRFAIDATPSMFDKHSILNVVNDTFYCEGTRAGALPRVEALSVINDIHQAISSVYSEFLSEDGSAFDYNAFSSSDAFQGVQASLERLQSIELSCLTESQKKATLLNIYNITCIIALITHPRPNGNLARMRWFDQQCIMIGGVVYSLNDIENGCLRGNSCPPYSFKKPFSKSDVRLATGLPVVDPRIHGALVCGARSCPVLRCFSIGNIDRELFQAMLEFIQRDVRIIDAQIQASMIFKWFKIDFGDDLLEFLTTYLSEEFISSCMSSTTSRNITYFPYDWTINS